MNKRIALIPSYEPNDALLKVVDELLKEDFTVVVVNDGSGVSYNEIFEPEAFKSPGLAFYGPLL